MQTGTYLIKTYGCQMNVHESEKIAGMLKSLGYEPTEDANQADVLVFNTCAIRDGAEQHVLGNVGAAKNLKKAKPDMIIAVGGCMTQVKGRADIFKKKYPFVNIVFGTHNLNEFKNYLLRYQNTKQNIYEIWDTEKEISENVEMYRASNYNAWVNIMYGCNNFCSYCIVPFVRGRERSRPLKDIVSEVEGLIAQGFKTITLLGQNVNSYGNDMKQNPITFAQLLDTLAKLDGDFKIKFMSSHPKDFGHDVVLAIAKHEKISKYIHLPVQSGSNRVLKLMNRNYTVEHYLSVIDDLKQNIPNVVLSTDIIVGFPQESEEDFLQTLNLMKTVRYDGVFGFMYSSRSGTVAEQMPQVDEAVKKDRIHRLMAVTKAITKEKTKEMVGQTVTAILESVGFIGDKKCYLCTTDSGKTIVVEKFDDVQVGHFCKVHITRFDKNKLFGEFVK